MAWIPVDSTTPTDTYLIVYSDGLRWRGMNGLAIAYLHSDFNGNKGVWTLDGRCGPIARGEQIPTKWDYLPAPPA
ncbi:hypothetical protein PMI01_02206 [Caulobacter sp. AP07]|uniref:hypothetical protein n=1 Tax=Caulobacter sp. AP07 TaxID=1144304 RepID=UPI000272202D|nr:hypothetical protein [Caulobacter sp. AP07]EJL33244.1 hypothetical protein PMI01_02206 [Caulobacter sp. AP07]